MIDDLFVDFRCSPAAAGRRGHGRDATVSGKPQQQPPLMPRMSNFPMPGDSSRRSVSSSLSSVLKQKLNGTKKLDTQKRGPCNGDHQSQNDSGNWQNGVPKHAKLLLSVLKIPPIDCGNFRLGRYVLTQRRKADCLVLAEMQSWCSLVNVARRRPSHISSAPWSPRLRG